MCSCAVPTSLDLRDRGARGVRILAGCFLAASCDGMTAPGWLTARELRADSKGVIDCTGSPSLLLDPRADFIGCVWAAAREAEV